MVERLDVKWVVPRGQRWAMGLSFAAWVCVVVALYFQAGRFGGGDGLLLALRLGQGCLLLYIGLGCSVTVLEVDGRDLVVTTLWRRVLRRAGLRESLDRVDLEWISGQLTLQRPAEGMVLRLGRGAGAREAADWLVARGVHPPVGG